MESYESDIAQFKLQIEKLRQNQVAEIDQRCREVDHLKLQLSEQLSSIQEDRDGLAKRLSSATSENELLKKQVSRLESEKVLISEQAMDENSTLRRECNTLKTRLVRISEHSKQLELENTALRSRLAKVQRLVIPLSLCNF